MDNTIKFQIQILKFFSITNGKFRNDSYNITNLLQTRFVDIILRQSIWSIYIVPYLS